MVTKLSWSDISNLLLQAQNKIVLIGPGLHSEWVEIIKTHPNRENLNIQVCIDNNENVLRSGYGSITSIDLLKQIGAVIKECEGLRFNFIGVDDKSYCLFIESRILSGDPHGFNALLIDSIKSSTIISQFFPNPAAKESPISHPLISKELDTEKVLEIKKSIEKNPPKHPDLQRQINTYKTHFQYAEIHFNGGNLKSKTITIPKEALPFKDAELKGRMKTNYNLFKEEDTKQWESISKIAEEVNRVRKEYLKSCSLRKGRNILKKENKANFSSEINELKKLVQDQSSGVLEDVQKAINKSKSVLKTELIDFFSNNLPKHISSYKDEKLQQEQLEEMVQEIIFKCKLPNATELIGKMSIDVQYAEFTEEDLNDKDFLDWFKENELISPETEHEIASFQKAFKTAE